MIIKKTWYTPNENLKKNELHHKTVLQHQYKYVEDTQVNTFTFSIF